MSLLASSALRALLLLGSPMAPPSVSEPAVVHDGGATPAGPEETDASAPDSVSILIGTDVGYDSDPFRAQAAGTLSLEKGPRGGISGGTLAFVDASPFEVGPFAQVLALFRRDVQPGDRASSTVLAQPLVGWKLDTPTFSTALSYAYQGLFVDGDPLLLTHRGALNAGMRFGDTQVKLEFSARREIIQVDEQNRFLGRAHSGFISSGWTFESGEFSLLYRGERYEMPDLASEQRDHGPALKAVGKLNPAFSLGGEVGALLRSFFSEGAFLGDGQVFTASAYGDWQSTSALSFRLGLQFTQGPSGSQALFYRRYAVSLGLSYFTGVL